MSKLKLIFSIAAGSVLLLIGAFLVLSGKGESCKNLSTADASKYVMTSLADDFAKKNVSRVGGERSVNEISVSRVERKVRVPGDEYYTVSLSSKRDGRRLGDVDIYKDCTFGWFISDMQ